MDRHKASINVMGTGWKVRPKKVKVLYLKACIQPAGIRSSTRHVKPCVKAGGPPPKAKYSLVTDSEEVP